MSRRKNYMNGGLVMGPSNRELEALEKKRKEDEAELVKKMNIPPRDEEKYPMPSEEDVRNAGALIWTMGQLAESYDGNLKALQWTYYVDLMNALKPNSAYDDLLALVDSITNLKKYMAESGNPLFTPNAKPAEDGPSQNGK